MAGPAPPIEWYIARDGKQYGPLTDLEMRKFVELGHLRPSDLVWRYGFPDWRPALAVFPAPRPRPQPVPPHPATPSPQPERRTPEARERPREFERPTQRQEPSYTQRQAPSYTTGAARTATPNAPVAVSDSFDEDDEEIEDDFLPEQPRRGRRRLVVAAVLLLLGGALWLAVDLIPSPLRLVALFEGPAQSSENAEGDSADTPPAETQNTAALRATQNNSGQEELAGALNDSELWQLLKRDYPEWYQERMQELARLRSEGQDEAAITKHLTQSVVTLRRQNAQQALSASPAALRKIAESFLDNLKHFASQSVDACYGFISRGETSPQVLELMGSPENAEMLQRQVAAVFEAIAEGRSAPQTHLPPRQADYQALTQALAGLGWKEREVQLFSNPRALAQAPPQEVCRLVQDWFTAQLSIPDEEIQLRLLFESLKPVVAG